MRHDVRRVHRLGRCTDQRQILVGNLDRRHGASLHEVRVQTLGRDASAVASWGDRIPMNPINGERQYSVKVEARCRKHDETLRKFV